MRLLLVLFVAACGSAAAVCPHAASPPPAPSPHPTPAVAAPPPPTIAIGAPGMTFEGELLCEAAADRRRFLGKCATAGSLVPPLIEAVHGWRHRHDEETVRLHVAADASLAMMRDVVTSLSNAGEGRFEMTYDADLAPRTVSLRAGDPKRSYYVDFHGGAQFRVRSREGALDSACSAQDPAQPAWHPTAELGACMRGLSELRPELVLVHVRDGVALPAIWTLARGLAADVPLGLDFSSVFEGE